MPRKDIEGLSRTTTSTLRRQEVWKDARIAQQEPRGFANITKDKWDQMVSLGKRKNRLTGNVTAFPARKHYNDIYC